MAQIGQLIGVVLKHENDIPHKGHPYGVFPVLTLRRSQCHEHAPAAEKEKDFLKFLFHYFYFFLGPTNCF